MAPSPQVILFARWPRTGRVKTRLAATLGDRAALALHEAMVLDGRERMRRLAGAGLEARVAWEDGERPGEDLLRHLEGRAGEGLQRGRDLGERMEEVLAAALASHRSPAVIVGTDSPTLPDDRIHAAIRAADSFDLVFGPSRDGGYYLIAARTRVPEIFRGIGWGGRLVLQQSLAAARKAGASVHLLEPWYDVDREGDLAALREELRDPSSPASLIAPHTRRALEAMR